MLKHACGALPYGDRPAAAPTDGITFALRTIVQKLNSMPPCLPVHSQRPLCNCCHRPEASGQAGLRRSYGLLHDLLAAMAHRTAIGTTVGGMVRGWPAAAVTLPGRPVHRLSLIRLGGRKGAALMTDGTTRWFRPGWSAAWWGCWWPGVSPGTQRAGSCSAWRCASSHYKTSLSG